LITIGEGIRDKSLPLPNAGQEGNKGAAGGGGERYTAKVAKVLFTRPQKGLLTPIRRVGGRELESFPSSAPRFKSQNQGGGGRYMCGNAAHLAHNPPNKDDGYSHSYHPALWFHNVIKPKPRRRFNHTIDNFTKITGWGIFRVGQWKI
jgi:hypothetical protein